MLIPDEENTELGTNANDQEEIQLEADGKSKGGIVEVSINNSFPEHVSPYNNQTGGNNNSVPGDNGICDKPVTNEENQQGNNGHSVTALINLQAGKSFDMVIPIIN